MPIYLVQLNGYTLIGNQCGFSPISGIGLVYYEPQTDINTDDLDTVLLDEGFQMPFKAYLMELELDPEKTVYPLLKKVRELGNMKVAPKGKKGCGDCGKLGELMGLLLNKDNVAFFCLS